MSGNRPSGWPRPLPDGRVLTADEAEGASLYRIVERRGPIDERLFRDLGRLEFDVEDCLELLALGAAAARAAVRNRGFEIRNALWAGATWRQVASATGLTAEEARAEFEQWSQHPAAQKARELRNESDEEAVGRYLRAGDDEVLPGRRGSSGQV